MFDRMAFSFFHLRLTLILDMRESTGFFPNFLVSLSFENFYIFRMSFRREKVWTFIFSFPSNRLVETSQLSTKFTIFLLDST